MEAVLDTNVLVSGLLNANTPSGETIDFIFNGSLIPVFDDRILYEYREVLARPKFSFPGTVVKELLEAVIIIGRQAIATHTHSRLPDESDRCFYECELSTPSKLLITGNKKHSPVRYCPGITTVSPAEFLAIMSQNS
jgi:putative PIN family toxin of toxin-antitoxin system